MSPADVKKLRDITGAGFGDCKKALEVSGGDFEKAERHLKEIGLASVAKRAGREANEGRVFGTIGSKGLAMILLSCETDFVARNETFADFGKKLVKQIADSGITELNETQNADLANIGSVIKENIGLKKAVFRALASDDVAFVYLHGDEGRKGSYVAAKVTGKSPSDPAVIQTAKDFALHVVANDPTFFSDADISAEYKKEQEGIFRVQAEGLGKPEAALGKIIEGKLNKHFNEIVFLKQAYLKDDKISVEKAAEVASKELNCEFVLKAMGMMAIGG